MAFKWFKKLVHKTNYSKVSGRNIHITEGWYVKFHQDLPSSLPQGMTLVTCNLKVPGFYHGWYNEQYHVD